MTVTVGFRDEFDTGWNEAHGRASTYGYTNGVINAQPHGRFIRLHGQQREVPAAAAGWESPGVRSPAPHKTVVRAGFGMYNDLQDALGYRTDQNAPFNPTYSLANAPVSTLPLNTSAPDSGRREAGSRRRAAEPANADPDLLVFPDRAGDHHQHGTDSRIRRLARIP